MSKVLKVVAIVASIAAAAVTLGASLGISAALLSAVSLGASVGASLLAKRPKAPANSGESINRLRANIDPRTPRKVWVGGGAGNTDIRDEEFTDSQAYLHRFIVVASHKIQEATSIFFDDKLAWTLAGGVQGEFAGYLTVTPILEGSAANAINISARMGSTRRYTGLAYVHLRYKLTGNSKKTDSPFAQSITTRITVRGKGALLYDPRLDSTLAGGSGAHRAATQSTWAWSDSACRNPALQLLWFLLGYKINGELAVGKGIPPARIDLESFAIAANLCDEAVALAAGGTEPRYRSDGVWSEGDSPTTVIDMLKASMNADLDDVDGKLRLTIFHNDLASPVASFTANDVLGDFDWQPSPPLDQSFNIVRGIYTDPSDASLYQPVDYPQVAVASPDGIDRIDTFDLPMVESAAQAQRLARLRLNRQKFGGVFEATFQATAWAVQKNSAITLSFPATGFVSKLLRVVEMELREDGVVPLKLREESTAIYGYVADAAPVAAVATTPFNPALDPIVGAITDLGVAIVGLAEITIAADYTGTVTAALPRTQPYMLFADGIDVTAQAAWSVAVLTGTISASIGAATGILSVNLSGGALINSTLRLTAVRAGVTKTLDVRVTKVAAAAPGSGSGGGTSASGGVNGTTSSATLTAVGDILTVTIGSGGTAQLSAAYEFTAAGSGTFGEFARWYRETSPGTWTAIGTEVAALSSYVSTAGSPGEGECNFTATGLTAAASEKFRLYMRNSSGVVTRTITGSCSAIGG